MAVGVEKVPVTKSGEPGQSHCANHSDLVAGTFFRLSEACPSQPERS